MSNATSPLGNVKQLLNGLRLEQRAIDIRRRALLFFALLLTLFTTLLLAERIFFMPPSVRMPLLLVVMHLIMLPVIQNIRALIRDKRLRHGRPAEEFWALKLGEYAPKPLRDRILNALQINQSQPTAGDNFSTDLAHEALLRVVAEIDPATSERALDSDGLKRSLRIAGLTLLTALVVVFTAPNSSFQAISRLAHPRQNYVVADQFSFKVSPANGWAYRNEAQSFFIQTDGAPPSRGWLFYQYDGGDVQRVEFTPTVDSAEVAFKGFADPITYWVGAGKVSGEKYRLNIVRRPQLVELNYTLNAPAYTRLPIVKGEENIGDVEAFPGSKLELAIRSNKKLSEAALIFLPENADSSELDTLMFSIAGSDGKVSRSLYKNGVYHVRLVDLDGHRDRDPVTYRVRMLQDEHPQVRITFPETDVQLGDQTVLPIQIEADDDFGIGKLSLAYHLLGQDTTINYHSLPLEQKNEASVKVDYFWDLGQVVLMPGDVVEYWAVAWDNDNVKEPKTAESERRLVRLPTIEEIIAEIDNTEEQSFGQVDEALENARDLKEKIDEILDEIRRNPEVDWEKQRQIEDAMQQQDAVQEQVKDLAKTLEQLAEKLEKYDMASMETLEKYQELQKLIAEISSPELKEAMEKLRQAMANQDPEEIRKALEEFQMDQESFMESIDRSMNILKQLQLERKLDALASQMEEMLAAQEQVVDQAKTEDPQTLAAEEKRLAKELEKFQQQLEAATKLAEENGEKELQSQLDSLATAMTEQQLSAQMNETAGDFQQGDLDQAAERSEEHARDMAQMLSGMKSMSKQLKDKKKADLGRKIRRATEDLLYVSEEQENLHVESKSLRTNSPRYRDLSGRQSDVRNSLDQITNQLFEISKETFFITPELGASLGKSSEEMGKALERFSGRTPMAVTRNQQKALGEINRSIKQLIDILDQLEGSNSSTGYEEMMEKLSEMAQQQQGLNQQSMPMPGSSGKPQQMPGGDQMQRMAAQQRALEAQMKQLSEEEGGGMQEVLGDLEGLAKSMGEVGKDMEDQNMTDRTRRLQRQIVSRLLDATRSARQEEYSRKRESKSGENMARRSPPEIKLDSDLEKLRQDMKRALQEGYTRDYRRLIRAYFQALEEVEQEK